MACGTKFSEAIISSVRCWRSSSCWMASAISGSTSARGRLKKSGLRSDMGAPRRLADCAQALRLSGLALPGGQFHLRASRDGADGSIPPRLHLDDLLDAAGVASALELRAQEGADDRVRVARAQAGAR